MSGLDVETFRITHVDALEWLHCLPAHEQARAQRIRLDGPRSCFVTARLAVRALLAERARCRPANVAICIAPGGAPSAPDTGWTFNTSHRDPHSLIAIARTPVGIDLEAIRSVDDATLIVQQQMHPAELAWLQGHHGSAAISAAFLRLWVRKEAVVKAATEGLSMRLDSWHVLPEITGSATFEVTDARGQSWQLHDGQLGATHVYALACVPGMRVHGPRILTPTWLARRFDVCER